MDTKTNGCKQLQFYIVVGLLRGGADMATNLVPL